MVPFKWCNLLLNVILANFLFDGADRAVHRQPGACTNYAHIKSCSIVASGHCALFG